jgi:hypothetical protein
MTRNAGPHSRVGAIMHRRASCLLALVVACEAPAAEQAPEPIAPPTSEPPPSPPVEAKVDAPAPPPVPTVPPAGPRWSAPPMPDGHEWRIVTEPLPGRVDLGLRLAVRRVGPLRLHELQGGELLVGADFVFAVAHTNGPLDTPVFDSRDILPHVEDPTEFGYGFMDWDVRISGRWPDDVVLAHEVSDGRLSFPYEMFRLDDGHWRPQDNRLPGALAWAYFDVTPWTNGTSLGRRMFVSTADPIDGEDGEEVLPRAARRALDKAQKSAKLDVLGGDAKPPAFGTRVDAWGSLATGEAIGIVGRRALHVAPDRRATALDLPALDDRTATLQVHMISGARAYAFGTSDPADLELRGDTMTYLAAYDGQRWHALALPPTRNADAPIEGLSATADGTLFAAVDGELWRHSAGAGWEGIAIPSAILPDVDHAPAETAMRVDDVVARGPDDVWVACRTGDDRGIYGGGAVLHTRDHGDLLELPGQAMLFADILSDRAQAAAKK